MSSRPPPILCAAMLALLWGGAAGSAGVARSGPRPPDTLTVAYEVAGLRVIQRINRASDVVAVRLYLLGGARQLTERTAGIEALLLRSSEYGTAQFPDEAARRAMARTGSIVSLEPEVDWTVFGFTGLARDLDQAWRVFADRVTHPALSERAVAQARGKLLSRARARYSNPDERIRILATAALFQDHPYALDPEGSEASLAALTPGDLQAYARDQLITSRMLLVVVGNVERAQVESLVGATLGQLPRGAYRWTLPPPAPELKPHWLVEHRAIPTNYILAYFTGPPPTSHGYWAFRLATALLSSELHRTVRSERSLSYAAFAPFIDQAIPVGGAYASTPKPQQVLPLMTAAIATLESGELDYFALSRFVDGFTFDYLAENASAADQAEFLARAELYLGNYRQGDEFVKRLRSVRPPEIRAVASGYMRRIQYAYLGDTVRMHGHW